MSTTIFTERRNDRNKGSFRRYCLSSRADQPRDQLRERVLHVRNNIANTNLLTTDTVLVEALNYFAAFRSDLKQTAVSVVEKLLSNPSTHIVTQTPSVFLDGMALYQGRLDKGYSLTDCISMNICRERSITDILTHDDHFRQEGFTVLL